MKPAAFEYCRPRTVSDVVDLLGSDESARVLAGGQSLIPAMNFRLTDVSLLVDIRDVHGFDALSCDDGEVTVAAAVTQTRGLDDDAIAAVWPGLRSALGYVGHLQIRNRGTICGSLAHADPAAELPALAVAAGASVSVAGPRGEREIAAADFFLGPYWTALDDGEVITSARFPVPVEGAVTVVDEIARRAGDFALAGLVAIVETEADAVRAARLVGFGVCGTPTSLINTEAALVGWSLGQPTAAFADAVAADTSEAFDDVHAPGWYRRDAVSALVARAARRVLASGEFQGSTLGN